MHQCEFCGKIVWFWQKKVFHGQYISHENFEAQWYNHKECEERNIRKNKEHEIETYFKRIGNYF